MRTVGVITGLTKHVRQHVVQRVDHFRLPTSGSSVDTNEGG